jgi:hypothetical protein
VSVSGPLPDTPTTYMDAVLEHLERARSFGRLLAEEVAALEAERDRLRCALREYGLHTVACVHWRAGERGRWPEDGEAAGGPCDCGFAEASA